MKVNFENFTGLYPLSKTLRFELRPVGATLDNFLKSGILEQDEHRAESYQKVKKLIDEYHKVFIDRVMNAYSIPYEDKGKLDSLTEYEANYMSKANDEDSKKRFEKLQENLRKAIANVLKKDEAFKRIDKKELIEQDLAGFINNAEPSQLHGLSKEQALALVAEFNGFTTYFGGFHQNRANMYSFEEQSTAIAHRLVNDNLPRFLDNINVFKRIVREPEILQNLSCLYEAFQSDISAESIQEMFQLGYYNSILTQNKIDIYNSVIGGKTLEDGQTKVQGLNEYINLYNQQHKDKRLPKLKTLYKQILSDRTTLSWLPEEFKNDQQMLTAIQECYEQLEEKILGEKDLKRLLESLSDYDLDGIFLRNDLQLTNISQKIYGSWGVIEQAIKADICKVAPAKKKKETEEDYQDRISAIFKQADSFSIQYINHCVKTFYLEEYRTIESYFGKLGAENTPTEQRENLFYRIANAYTDVAPLLRCDYPKGKSIAQDKANVERIKNLLDAIKTLQWFVKPLLGKGDESGKDERFYGELTSLWNQLDSVTLLYNKVRNRMTQKPYSEEKIKLNFENSLLLNGWDENKESDNACIILRRNGMYYLAIMNKGHRALLKKPMPVTGECYEKMIYKLLPGANKMLPKVFFSKSRIDEFKPSEQLLANYDKGTHKKGENFNIEDCHELIDFFKQSIAKHPDWRKFGFKFSSTSTYEDLSGFYREVEQQGYKVTFNPVSMSYVEQLVNEGKMYLFQIYNKDFSVFSKGTPNLHTLYWKALFSEANLANVVYKLNGEAEVFYRKKSITVSHPTHPANQPVRNKNKQNSKKESLFTYDLIKDRRYTVDKFMFHVPITMNFKSTGASNINLAVREYLQTADNAHVIGIDRGERHLLYLVVTDRHGTIKEQFSLNEIVNTYNENTYQTNYHDLLDTREKERREARQSWQTIENIKELKEGYLSQVVHKIAQLMIKYRAIVVLEDLNMGFMRGRQKVEKQVYQKFEKMLIDKLNYLVDKNLEADRPGGLLHAYQLASPFESFRKLGKQSGFLFYIPAWNTSKIDPVTGFVNLLDVKYSSVEQSKAFFSKFKSIRYNAEKQWFEFAFDYSDFGAKAEGTKTKWTLCTHGERIVSFRNPDKNNQWDNQPIDLTQRFLALFEQYRIDIHDNLKEAIVMQTKKDFFEELTLCLRLTLQMRNSVTGTAEDYLISPVADENGCFYDSRKCGKDLPENADANGAYNIARKGLMMIAQIRKAEDLKKLKFDLTNKSWLNFAQQKPYLHD